MKISFSREQWVKIGTQMGWIKTASFTMHVKGFPYSEYPELDNLLDVSHQAILPFAKLAQEILGEQYKTFWKYSNTLTPDGGSEFEPKGIMNLYLRGAGPDKVKALVDAAVEVLNNLPGVKASSIKVDNGKDGLPRVARIAVSTEGLGESQRPPHLQMANDNAFFIFQKILGYTQDLWDKGIFDASELKKRAAYYIRESSFPETPTYQLNEHHQKIQDAFSGASEDEGFESGVGDMLSGRNAISTYDRNDIIRRLDDIIKFCNWALERGYTTVYLA